MMRVVHLLRKLDPSEWSGTEVAIHRLFEGLRDQGVKPVAYCPNANGANHLDPLKTSGFEVRRFKAFVPILGVPAARKRQLISVGGNLMSFDLIHSLWHEEQFSVMHSHTLGRLGGIALSLAKKREVPFVVTIHGGVLDLPQELKSNFNKRAEKGWEWGRLFGLFFQSRRLFKDASAILTCNENEARLLSERLPGKRILVQPHGVPVEIYQEDQRAAAQAAYPRICQRQVILSLGRIDPIKNQGWLIEQAAQIFEKHSRALLVLAGPCTDEPYQARLVRQIHDLGIEDRVILTGGLGATDPRLIGLLQSAEVLVLPSLSETFGLVILEAWAAGTPVLATAASGPNALVQNGVNGWLFDLKKPATFHEALDWTLTHPKMARQMAQAGSRLSEQFSVQASAAKLRELYGHLIEEKNALRNHSRR